MILCRISLSPPPSFKLESADHGYTNNQLNQRLHLNLSQRSAYSPPNKENEFRKGFKTDLQIESYPEVSKIDDINQGTPTPKREPAQRMLTPLFNKIAHIIEVTLHFIY